jgi:uncharacterized protein
MHGFGHAAGYGQGLGGFGGEVDRPTEVINNYYGDDRGESGGHDVTGAERTMGDQVDRDFGGKSDAGRDSGTDSGSDRDSLYGAGDDSGSDKGDDSGYDDGGPNFDDSGSNFDDSSYDDGGGDFGGGGDDSSF